MNSVEFMVMVKSLRANRMIDISNEWNLGNGESLLDVNLNSINTASNKALPLYM